MQGIYGSAEAQFSAHHAGCSSVPHVVDNGTPFSISEHLHAAFTQPGPGLQSHRLYNKRDTISAYVQFIYNLGQSARVGHT